MVAYSTMFRVSSILSTLPAWRQGLTVFQRYALAGTAPNTALPSPAPPPGSFGGVFAYSGGYLIRATSEFGRAWTGGHTDYAGNETAYNPLGNAALGPWLFRALPTPNNLIPPLAGAGAFDYYNDGPGNVYPGKPVADHCYDNVWHSVAQNRIFKFGGSFTWGNPPGGSRHIDALNLATNTYDPKGTWPNLPWSDGGGGGSFYDFDNDIFYRIPVNGSSNLVAVDTKLLPSTSAFSTYTPFTPSSQNWGQFALSGTDLGVAFDTKRRQAWWNGTKVDGSGTRVCARMDVPNGKLTSLALSAPWAGGSPVYDEGLDRMLYFSSDGNACVSVHPDTLVATTLTLTGVTIPAGDNGNLLYTRLKYAPGLKGIVIVPGVNQPTHFIPTQ